MGYSTVTISKETAFAKLKRCVVEVDSASDVELFGNAPYLDEVTSVCESDHGHIILNLKGQRWVDYKIVNVKPLTEAEQVKQTGRY